MPSEEWAQERESLLQWIDSQIATPGGVLLLVVVGALFLGALLLTAFLLAQLGRRARAVSLPAPTWQGIDLLACLLGWLFVQILAHQVAALLAPSLPGIETELRIVCQGLASLAYCAVLLALPLYRGQPIVALGIGSDTVGSGLFQGIIVWACAIPGLFATLIGTHLVFLLLGVEPDRQEAVELFQGSISRREVALAIALLGFAIVVAPLLEEILFRAILYRWLAARFGVVAGATLSGLLFGLVHGSFSALLPIALLGILLALLLERTGNLWSCVALHSVFNAGQLTLMLVLGDAAR